MTQPNKKLRENVAKILQGHTGWWIINKSLAVADEILALLPQPEVMSKKEQLRADFKTHNEIIEAIKEPEKVGEEGRCVKCGNIVQKEGCPACGGKQYIIASQPVKVELPEELELKFLIEGDYLKDSTIALNEIVRIKQTINQIIISNKALCAVVEELTKDVNYLKSKN